MASYFITGATGFIGTHLCHKLLTLGHQVKALVRNKQKAHSLPVNHPALQLVEGDLLTTKGYASALHNCDGVFHLAAYAKSWAKSLDTFYHINVDGTLGLLSECVEQQVPRVVITSTAGVYGPSFELTITEDVSQVIPHITTYEKSKAQADEQASAFLDKLQLVWLHPTRVYGPGAMSESNAATMLIERRLQGEMPIIPGNGHQIGNYVLVDDVVEGHRLAMEKAESGAHFILGGENLSYRSLYQLIDRLSNTRSPIWPLPLWLMKTIARVDTWKAELTGRPPLITPDFVVKYHHNWKVSSQKAMQLLGYQPTSAAVGIEKTIHWLQEQKQKTLKDMPSSQGEVRA